MQQSLCIIQVDLTLDWDSEVWAVDASEWGAGVCRACTDQSSVAATGRYPERWRFKLGEPVSLRLLARSLIKEDVFAEKGADAAAAVDMQVTRAWLKAEAAEIVRVAESLNRASDIPLVPYVSGRLMGVNWRTTLSTPWRRAEPIAVLEARALGLCVRDVARRSLDRPRHALILSDSIGALLATTKCRSSRPGMCRALRSIAACALIAGLTIVVRWVASELDVADHPSRRGIRRGWTPPEGRGAGPGHGRGPPAPRGRAEPPAPGGGTHAATRRRPGVFAGDVPPQGGATNGASCRRSGACRRGAKKTHSHGSAPSDGGSDASADCAAMPLGGGAAKPAPEESRAVAADSNSLRPAAVAPGLADPWAAALALGIGWQERR